MASAYAGSSGRYLRMGSSYESFPCSIASAAAIAVNCFDTDPA
jgi:hypothetical protein